MVVVGMLYYFVHSQFPIEKYLRSSKYLYLRSTNMLTVSIHTYCIRWLAQSIVNTIQLNKSCVTLGVCGHGFDSCKGKWEHVQTTLVNLPELNCGSWGDVAFARHYGCFMFISVAY